MSYILEALKRADAERERGAVPTLHSQAVPAPSASPSRAPNSAWMAALAALAVVVTGALWWALGRPTPPPAVPPQNVAPAPMSATQASSPSATNVTGATPPVMAAITPAPAPPKPAAPAPAVRKSAEPTPRAMPTRPAASDAVAATTLGTTAKASPAPALAAPPAPAASAAKPLVFTLAELPDDIRLQLPKLTVSGVTYSAQAGFRMLIVNGQVLRENDEPAPGLTLETIRQKDAVWRFKGYRYSQSY